MYVAMALLISSCATSKQARTYQHTINGNWSVVSVKTEGISGKVIAKSFNEANATCFEGSTWSFNEHTNLGSYVILKNAGDCAAMKREIRWSVYEAAGQPKSFQFKRLDSKLKEIDENGGGFRMNISQIDKTTMTLRSEITFEGKPAAIVYSFERKQ